MHPTPPTTRLLPLQTRMINASNGMRLRVVSGHFWLTQPNAEQDLFLGPGAGPRPPADAPPCYSEYLLTPLAEAVRNPAWSHAVWRVVQRWIRQAAAATRSAWPRAFAK